MVEHTAPTQPESSKSLAKWVLIIRAAHLRPVCRRSDSPLDLSLKNVLTKELQLGLKDVTDFFFFATFPWYIKPIAGLLSDSIPLFGTRRRHYLILSSVFAAIIWLLLGVIPRSYWLLFVLLTMLNVMLVIGSTVVGALIVEVGQSHDAAGRLVAVRNFIESACGVIAGTFGGLLAYHMSFSWAAVIGAAIAFSLAPLAYVWLTEPIKTKYNSSVLKKASREMRRLASSRLMWPAALFIFFVSIPQGFEEARYFYQWKDLGLSTQEIGYLMSASGGGAAVACVVYGFVCPFVRLRVLLAVGILSTAAGTVIYVFYTSYQAAVAIEALSGFLTTIGVLALMEIAVWATPREAAATGFSLLMSAWNLGDGAGNILTARLIEDFHVSFFVVIGFYTAATVVFLAAIWLLPNDLFNNPEG